MIKFKLYSALFTKESWNAGSHGVTSIPDGAIRSDIKYKGNSSIYGDRIVVWQHPDFIDKLGSARVSSFILDDYSNNTDLLNDIGKLNSVDKKRFDIITGYLKRGMYVYDDNDKEIRKNIRSSDPVYNGWDTKTHYLEIFQLNNNDILPYSKDINSKVRLTYDVCRPVYENGKWVCHIILNRCGVHKYGNKRYSNY